MKYKNPQLVMQGEKLETSAKLRGFVWNISSPSLNKLFEMQVFVSCISPSLEHSATYSFFFVFKCKFGGRHVLKENLKTVCLIKNHQNNLYLVIIKLEFVVLSFDLKDLNLNKHFKCWRKGLSFT